MEKTSFVNLLGVSIVAFLVPFVLGFFPKVRIPSVVLELIGGIIIGPAVLNWIQPGPVVTIISNLGIAFLLFLAGMEFNLRVLRGPPLRLGGLAFVLTVVAGLVIMVPLGAAGLVLSPLLVATTLAATSMGIVVPVLRDSCTIDDPLGRFVMGGGSIAEFGTIALLGVFFAGPQGSAWVEALLLAVVAVLAVLLLFAISRFVNWEPGRLVTKRLDETTSQVRVRFAVMVLLVAAVVASAFGFEAILGTFLAGAVLAIVIRGDSSEDSFRRKLEAIGYGFFVPVFFVTSGLNFSLQGLASLGVIARIAFFVVALLVVHGVPSLLYRLHLGWRETIAAGLLQATNISFIAVAVAVGVDLHQMRPLTASSLLAAGLISAVAFPPLAGAILRTKPPPAEGGCAEHV